MGLEHAQSLVYALDPGPNPLKMGREDCDSLMKPENMRLHSCFPPFVMVPQHSSKYVRLSVVLTVRKWGHRIKGVTLKNIWAIWGVLQQQPSSRLRRE